MSRVRTQTSVNFNSGLQRFVFIILRPDGATFAISLVFDRPMSQTMIYFSGVLVLLLMGTREAKDNISGGMCFYQEPNGLAKIFTKMPQHHKNGILKLAVGCCTWF